MQFSAIALICPLASSIFAPGIDLMADDFGVSEQAIAVGQTTFVAMLGIGPLFLAPMSEAFGRYGMLSLHFVMLMCWKVDGKSSCSVPVYSRCCRYLRLWHPM